MKAIWRGFGLLGVIAFIYVLSIRLFKPNNENNFPTSQAEQPQVISAKQPAQIFLEAEKSLPEQTQARSSGVEGLPTAESVLKRAPPSGIELELPTNADRKAMMEFRARHGGEALGRILNLRQLRDVVEREHAIRKKAESLWEGMGVPQLVEQMGEPHGVTTGDDPRAINPTTSARALKPVPGEIPFRNAFVLSWDRQSPTPFSKLNLAGHPTEFLYSSHPFATQHQPFGSPSYKVLYLSIDERGILTKFEWIECCAGMD